MHLYPSTLIMDIFGTFMPDLFGINNDGKDKKDDEGIPLRSALKPQPPPDWFGSDEDRDNVLMDPRKLQRTSNSRDIRVVHFAKEDDSNSFKSFKSFDSFIEINEVDLTPIRDVTIDLFAQNEELFVPLLSDNLLSLVFDQESTFCKKLQEKLHYFNPLNYGDISSEGKSRVSVLQAIIEPSLIQVVVEGSMVYEPNEKKLERVDETASFELSCTEYRKLSVEEAMASLNEYLI